MLKRRESITLSSVISSLVSRPFDVYGCFNLGFLTICLESDGSPLGNYAVDEKCK